MSSFQRILDSVKDINPAAAPLQLEMLDFSLPTAIAYSGKNTAVTITALPNTGYAGAVVVHYNRRDLATVADDLHIALPVGFTPEILAQYLGTQPGVEITGVDLLPVDDTGMDVGFNGVVVIHADPNSYDWFGQLTIVVTITAGIDDNINTVLAQLNDLSVEFHDFKTVVTGELTEGSGLLKSLKLNFSSSDYFLGQPVYAVASNGVALSVATDSAKVNPVGLVSSDIIESGGGSGNIQTQGILTGTFSQWQYATGMSGGLLPGSTYYLSNTLGKLTPYAPLEDGSYIVAVGKALSTTELSINIGNPISN
jgi:hypothetical protein